MLQQQQPNAAPWWSQHGEAAPPAASKVQHREAVGAPFWSQHAAGEAKEKHDAMGAPFRSQHGTKHEAMGAPIWSQHKAGAAVGAKQPAAPWWSQHHAGEASPFPASGSKAHAAPRWSQHHAQHKASAVAPRAAGWMHGERKAAHEAMKKFAPHHKLPPHVASLTAAAPLWEKSAEAVPAAAAKWKQAVQKIKRAWLGYLRGGP